MIRTFRHKGLEELYRKGVTRRIHPDFVRKCCRILQLLDLAERAQDLDIAGLRYHALHGKPQRWSVRVSANDRITFGWSDDGPIDIDFEDYH